MTASVIDRPRQASDSDRVVEVLVTIVQPPAPGPGQSDIGIHTRLYDALSPDRLAMTDGLSWRVASRRWLDAQYLVGEVAGFDLDDAGTLGLARLQLPFAIRVDNLSLAVQLAAPVLGAREAVQILGELMSIGQSATAPWTLGSTSGEVPLSIWLRSLSRFTELEVIVHRPNPRYLGRTFVEQTLEPTGAESVKFTFFARARESLQRLSDVIRQLVGHVEAGYGAAYARGESIAADGTPSAVEFLTGLGGPIETQEVRVPGGESNVAEPTMVAILADRAAAT